jgi:hypothetical protein
LKLEFNLNFINSELFIINFTPTTIKHLNIDYIDEYFKIIIRQLYYKDLTINQINFITDFNYFNIKSLLDIVNSIQKYLITDFSLHNLYYFMNCLS